MPQTVQFNTQRSLYHTGQGYEYFNPPAQTKSRPENRSNLATAAKHTPGTSKKLKQRNIF
jgi:hypothetical protein